MKSHEFADSFQFDFDFSNALSEIVTSVPAGRLNNQKMMTLNDIVHSKLFTFPECRAILLPVVVRRVKELLTGPQEVSNRQSYGNMNASFIFLYYSLRVVS